MAESLSVPPVVRNVLVVTVSYRTADLVCQSLKALDDERRLLANSGTALRAVVVDNDSGDATTLEHYVRERQIEQWATVLRADRNGGFAYGCNFGMRFGFESGPIPTYVFLLNPDAAVRPRAIAALIEYLDAHPTVGIAGGILEEPDGSALRRAFRFPSLLSEIDAALETGLVTKLLSRYVVCRRMGDAPERVDWVSGAAMLIRSEVIEQLGGLDEAYFLYWEETDFCWKARGAGWSVAYVPASRVMHDAGASTGILNQQSGAKRRPAYWFESRRRFFAKNYGIAYAIATDTVFVVTCMVGHLKRVALGRMGSVPAHFLRDFLRHSSIYPQHWKIASPIEYRPDRPSRATESSR